MIELLIAAGFGAVALEAARNLIRAQAPKVGSGSSGSSQWVTLGSIPMVGSRGVARTATYRQIYLTNPWVYAAVNKLARDIARLPLHVFELSEDGRRRRVRGDVPTTPGRPLAGESLDRLLRKPENYSRFAHWFGTGVDRLVYGNALWELERDAGGGPPVSVRRERWRNVRWVDEASDGTPRFYEIGKSYRYGKNRRLAPDEVIHFGRGTDPEGPVGLSPIEACRHTVALHEAVVRHLVAFFANSARPSGHFKVENRLTPTKAAEIRQMITDAYSSPENAGKVLVSSASWEGMGENPDHSKVVELIQLSREEVATVYGVPPPVLGILDRAIKSNVKELREQYVREGVGPWATEFEEELMAQLLGLAPGWRYLFVEFLLAEQLRPDLEARSQVYERLKHMESIDEQREFENLPALDLPGVSDVPWVDSGALPITAFATGSPFMERAAQAYGRALAERSGGRSDSPNGQHPQAEEEALV